MHLLQEICRPPGCEITEHCSVNTAQVKDIHITRYTLFDNTTHKSEKAAHVVRSRPLSQSACVGLRYGTSAVFATISRQARLLHRSESRKHDDLPQGVIYSR